MLLPVALNVQGKRCLIVGGGPVAARKVQSLVECAAEVTVIAPELCAELLEIEGIKEQWKRTYGAGDCNGFALVFACTDQRAVNEQVALEAQQLGIWCNIADDAANSDFHGAAAVRRGGICVGISTEGGSPALSRHLKQEIESRVGPEYATLLELMSARRAAVAGLPDAQSARAAVWRSILQSETLRLLREGRRDEAEDLIDRLIAASSETMKPTGDDA